MTKFSIGLLANFLDRPTDVVKLAYEAERAGWHGVQLVEYEYDTFAFAQAIACSTRRIFTGTCISRAFTRHPLLVAETAVAIDHLSAGRFVIGLGTGGVSAPSSDAQRRIGGRAAREIKPGTSLQRWGTGSNRPAARMREQIEVVRLALTGDVIDYSGEFFQFEGFQLSIAPTGPIPIYLGARGHHMLELAGEAADGVYLWMMGEAATRKSIASVRRGAERANRPAESVSIGSLIPTCVAADGDAARRAARRNLVDFYLSRAPYADALPGAGFPEVGAEVRARAEAADFEGAADAIPDDALDQLAIAGTPEQCRDAMKHWTARGIDAPVLYVFPADGDWASSYRLALTELSPNR
jgi:alkanesulfonate monooxygenase SsuD/methylene tetrahydromethanopterin reductase-like flavin-dependent oxidoreductase (luciferase family)